jgi:hypothetical protein
MSLAEAGEIFAYWEQNPPAHLIVQALARLLGWRPPSAAAEAAPIAALAAAPPPGLLVGHPGDRGMPAPVLDAASLRARNRARALAIALRNPSPATR